MVSLRGQKSWGMPWFVSFSGLIQNFQIHVASPPFHVQSPPPPTPIPYDQFPQRWFKMLKACRLMTTSLGILSANTQFAVTSMSDLKTYMFALLL